MTHATGTATRADGPALDVRQRNVAFATIMLGVLDGDAGRHPLLEPATSPA
jgi:hypothetical protein